MAKLAQINIEKDIPLKQAEIRKLVQTGYKNDSK